MRSACHSRVLMAFAGESSTADLIMTRGQVANAQREAKKKADAANKRSDEIGRTIAELREQLAQGQAELDAAIRDQNRAEHDRGYWFQHFSNSDTVSPLSRKETDGQHSETQRRCRARYRDVSGKEHAAHFPTKTKAQAWLDTQNAALVRNDWVDPNRSRVTVGAWGEQWLAGRVNLKPKTKLGYDNLFRRRSSRRGNTCASTRSEMEDVVEWVAKMTTKFSPSRTRQA